jgi:hypothetical protein
VTVVVWEVVWVSDSVVEVPGDGVALAVPLAVWLNPAEMVAVRVGFAIVVVARSAIPIAW